MWTMPIKFLVLGGGGFWVFWGGGFLVFLGGGGSPDFFYGREDFSE